MIAHIVLLQPRETLTLDERHAALETLSQSAASITGITRFRIGRRIRHGLPGYEQQMVTDFQLVLLLEFDSVDALTAYLTAPAHAAIGDLFVTATSAALAYDYEMRELGAADAEWLRP